MGITRKQLKSFGATDYLIKRLTHSLAPVDRQGRAYVYDLAQVIDSVRDLLETSRLRQTTKAVLHHLKKQLSEFIAESLPRFDNRLQQAIHQAEAANRRFEQTAHEARKVSKAFQVHKQQRGLNLNFSNNIVAFTT
jgi:hypothetical protein